MSSSGKASVALAFLVALIRREPAFIGNLILSAVDRDPKGAWRALGSLFGDD